MFIISQTTYSFSNRHRSKKDRERACRYAESSTFYRWPEGLSESQLNSTVTFSINYCPNWLVFKIYKFLYTLKFSISLEWCHLTKLLRCLGLQFVHLPIASLNIWCPCFWKRNPRFSRRSFKTKVLLTKVLFSTDLKPYLCQRPPLMMNIKIPFHPHRQILLFLFYYPLKPAWPS